MAKSVQEQIKKIKKNMAILITVGAALLLMAVYSLIEPHWMKVDYSTQIVPDLPNEFNGMRVVFLSDFHYGKWFSNGRLAEMVEEINKQNADLILLGGDFAENKEDFIECVNELSKLRSELGVFAVAGNHDTYVTEDEFTRILRENTITPCAKESFEIKRGGAHIYVAGYPFWHVKNIMLPTNISVKKEDCVLLLTHSPKDVQFSDCSADIAFTGHTHGGQVSFFGMFGIMSRPFHAYRSHWYNEAGINTLHSNGIGMHTLPIRFFARPEWHVITLINAK